MEQNCDRCGNIIKHGSAYVTITRELEYFDNNIHEKSEVVTVIDAVQILVFCTHCGEYFTADKVRQIIKREM